MSFDNVHNSLRTPSTDATPASLQPLPAATDKASRGVQEALKRLGEMTVEAAVASPKEVSAPTFIDANGKTFTCDIEDLWDEENAKGGKFLRTSVMTEDVQRYCQKKGIKMISISGSFDPNLYQLLQGFECIYANLQNAPLAAAAKLIRENKDLVGLKWKGSKDAGDMQSIGDALNRRNFRFLSLSGFSATEEDIAIMNDIRVSNPKLAISFETVSLYSSGFNPAQKSLQTTKSASEQGEVKFIDDDETFLDQDVDALGKWERLTTSSLNQTVVQYCQKHAIKSIKVTVPFVSAMNPLLTGFKKVCLLNLNGSRLDVVPTIFKNNPELISLEVRGDVDVGLQGICDNLPNYPNLRYLKLDVFGSSPQNLQRFLLPALKNCSHPLQVDINLDFPFERV